jgi:hypothetical protein
LGTEDKVALGVGLGLGIPGLLTIVWKYCSIYRPRLWVRNPRNSPVHSVNPSIAPHPAVLLPLAPSSQPSVDNAQTPQVDMQHERLDQIPADMNEKVDNETLTDLTGKVTKRSTLALAFGSFAAIWQGEYEGALVAIKVPRLHANNMAANKLVKVSHSLSNVVKCWQILHPMMAEVAYLIFPDDMAPFLLERTYLCTNSHFLTPPYTTENTT